MNLIPIIRAIIVTCTLASIRRAIEIGASAVEVDAKPATMDNYSCFTTRRSTEPRMRGAFRHGEYRYGTGRQHHLDIDQALHLEGWGWYYSVLFWVDSLISVRVAHVFWGTSHPKSV